MEAGAGADSSTPTNDGKWQVTFREKQILLAARAIWNVRAQQCGSTTQWKDLLDSVRAEYREQAAAVVAALEEGAEPLERGTDRLQRALW